MRRRFRASALWQEVANGFPPPLRRDLRDSQECPEGPSSQSPSTWSESATGDDLASQDSPYCGRSLEPSPSSL